MRLKAELAQEEAAAQSLRSRLTAPGGAGPPGASFATLPAPAPHAYATANLPLQQRDVPQASAAAVCARDARGECARAARATHGRAQESARVAHEAGEASEERARSGRGKLGERGARLARAGAMCVCRAREAREARRCARAQVAHGALEARWRGERAVARAARAARGARGRAHDSGRGRMMAGAGGWRAARGLCGALCGLRAPTADGGASVRPDRWTSARASRGRAGDLE